MEGGGGDGTQPVVLPPPPAMPDGGAPATSMALVDPATLGKRQDDSSESEESEGEEELPPGPIDPERCILSGPGFSGGAAGAPIVFRLTAKDAHGKNTAEGGDYVTARVSPGASAVNAGAKQGDIEVEVEDNQNGTYVGTYEVPCRGDYELVVEINGQPVGGSPFPLFFSPPDPNAPPPKPKKPKAGAEAAGDAAAEEAPAKPKYDLPPAPQISILAYCSS